MSGRLRWPESLGDSGDALYVVDHARRIVRWNGPAERLLGHAAPDVLGRSCWQVIAGRGRNGRAVCGPNCAVHRCVERGELPCGIEIQVRARDGRRLWVRQSVLVVPHDPGPLILHVLDDVSDGRRAMDVIDQVSSLCHAADLHAEPGCPAAFTGREREVLRLIADGLSGKMVAERLGISSLTVRNHVQHILAKCGAHSRAEAIALAFRRRLV